MRHQTVHGAHLALRHVQRQLTRVDRTTHEHPLRLPTQPICAATLEIAAYGETSLPREGTPPRRPAFQKRPLRRTAASARCSSAATRDRLIASLLGFVQRSSQPLRLPDSPRCSLQASLSRKGAAVGVSAETSGHGRRVKVRRLVFPRRRPGALCGARAGQGPAQAGSGGLVVSRQSLSTLWVAAISRHSARQARSPRRWKRSVHRTRLVCANTGSMICARWR